MKPVRAAVLGLWICALAAWFAVDATPVAIAQHVPALAPGQTRVDPDADGRIAGEVVDGRTGRPAAGIPVGLYHPREVEAREWPEPWVDVSPEIDATPIATVRAASEGQFLFDGLPPGIYRVAPLVAARSEEVEVAIEEGGAASVQLVAYIGASVSGVVRGERGEPLGAVSVFVAARDDGTGTNTREPLWNHRVETDPDGAFQLRDLPVGLLYLQAARRDRGWSAPLLIETAERRHVEGVEFVVPDHTAEISRGREERGALGLSLVFDGQGVIVRSVVEGMPAANAGVQAGDRILTIAGRSTRWMTRREFLRLARGAVGAPAELTLSRDGGPPLDVSVVRAPRPDGS